MNQLHLKFKRDSGIEPIVGLCWDEMVDMYDTIPFLELTKKEIISCLNYDNRHNVINAIKQENLPDENCDSEGITIYRNQYVLWLEEKLNDLLK